MKEYRVIITVGGDALTQRVNEAIQEGWQPIGGAGISINEGVLPAPQGQTAHMVTLIQAMIR